MFSRTSGRALTTRATQDVDLFTGQEHGVEAAAAAVEAALSTAGLQAERQADPADLADLFPGRGQGLAEWTITAPGGAQSMLQMAYFDRSSAPVVMEVGPVLAPEDVAGGKVCTRLISGIRRARSRGVPQASTGRTQRTSGSCTKSMMKPQRCASSTSGSSPEADRTVTRGARPDAQAADGRPRVTVVVGLAGVAPSDRNGHCRHRPNQPGAGTGM